MRYFPDPPPILSSEEGKILSEYLYRQLLQLSGEQIHDLDKNGLAPDHVVDGMIRYANGTGWNPGNGEGFYIYFQNRWHYISTTSSDGVWEDLTSDLSASKPGASTPGFDIFRDNIKFYAFDDSLEEELYINFHILHDLLISDESKLFIHMHWSPGNNTNTGVVRWGFELTYAKGHQQESFPTTNTIYIEQAGPGVAYKHMIAEVSYEDAIPSTDLETDSMLCVRVFRDVGSSRDTFSGDAFGIECDIHYLKNGKTGTKNKAPDFDNDSYLRSNTGLLTIVGGTPTIT